ncbi:helix-turn-helix domain-containing protein [Pseudonocardia nantongensis]|uniref:helix-turn-helix domain-containing protein n=1 Tax=Pseudonocardia nantongensis TaxID=1181885 RepID=UPI00397BDF58
MTGPEETGERAPGAAPTLGERLHTLRTSVHPADRSPYTLEEVSEGIRRRGETVSAAYLHQMETGKRPNPSLQKLEAIVAFYGVTLAYLFNDRVAQEVDEEIALLQAIRDHGVKDIAMRALDLDPEYRQSISRIIREMGDLQQRSGHPGRRRRRGDG